MDEQDPAPNGYEWNWEEENTREPEDASWFDQFEQLFYGSSNGEGAAAVDGGAVPVEGGAVPVEGGAAAVEGGAVPVEGGAVPVEGGEDTADPSQLVPTEEWTAAEEWTTTEGATQEWTTTEEAATNETEQSHTDTTLQQAYPAYHGYDQQQPAPSIPYDYEYVDANAQATDLFNTEQCIHTYNVVNTVEEIHTPEDILLNQCHLMSVAGEITEYEESYLQQLVLQKDPSVKEALRRYSLWRHPS